MSAPHKKSCPQFGTQAGPVRRPCTCEQSEFDFCAICDHIRELHELPFVECSHPFTPRRSDQPESKP